LLNGPFFGILISKIKNVSMKRIFLGISLLLSFTASAQLGALNQYHFNYLAVNPALAGENGPFTIKAIGANQFNGNLRFNQLSYGLVLDGQLNNKFGLAFQSSSDNFGVGASSNNLGLSLSKGVEVGDLKLKAGVSGGVTLLPNSLVFGNSGTRADFNLGLGLFASYNGAFAGVSKPSAFTSKNSFNGESPLFINAGYTSDPEYFVSYNANVLYGNLNGNSNYDFNLKLWFDKQLAVGGSYRINNIYTLYSKKSSFVPMVEYKVTKDLMLGLAYSSNPLRLSNEPVGGNQNFKVNGLFQFYIRYNKADKKGDSWYYDQF
jgi:type IX secretion system PorP/SprF family membrane protein